MKNLPSFPTRPVFTSALTALVALLAHFAAPSAFAADYYYDANDTPPGFGTASGTSAAMLLPALSRAKEQAKRTACLNNLKQIKFGGVWGDNANNPPPGGRQLFVHQDRLEEVCGNQTANLQKIQ
jgi:hypothetical protein